MKIKEIQWLGFIILGLMVSSQLSAALLITVNANTEMLTITASDTGVGVTNLEWERGTGGISGGAVDVTSGFLTELSAPVDLATLTVANTGAVLSIDNGIVSLTGLTGTGVSISYASALTSAQKTFLEGMSSITLTSIALGWGNVNVTQVAAVPEAQTMGILMGAVLLGFIAVRRRVSR